MILPLVQFTSPYYKVFILPKHKTCTLISESKSKEQLHRQELSMVPQETQEWYERCVTLPLTAGDLDYSVGVLGLWWNFHSNFLWNTCISRVMCYHTSYRLLLNSDFRRTKETQILFIRRYDKLYERMWNNQDNAILRSRKVVS